MVWVVQIASMHVILRQMCHCPEDECGDIEEQAETPHQQTAQFGVFWPSHSAIGHRMHQCHKAINANQNEKVDAAVGVYLNAQVDDFAQEQTERPVETAGYVDSPEGQTGNQDEVSSGQVAQVDLSHGAGLLVEAENHQNKQIEYDPKHSDEQDIHRLPGIEPRPRLPLGTISAIGYVLASKKSGCAEVWYAVEKIKQIWLNTDGKATNFVCCPSLFYLLKLLLY